MVAEQITQWLYVLYPMLLGMLDRKQSWLVAFASSLNEYRQVSDIRRALVGNKIVDNSDVVGASPVGAAPTTSSLST